MATSKVPRVPTNRIGIFHLAATSGVTAIVIFILCWLGTFIPFSSPTHAYVGLFTQAEMQSGAALVEGGLWSLLLGGLSGGLIAVFYNMFANLR